MPDKEASDSAKAELAFREVVRGLELQERTIESLRTRGGLVLSTAFILAAFVANATHARGGWWWVGVGVMVPVAGFITASGWPISLWATNSGYLLVSHYVDVAEVSVAVMCRDLALYGQANWERNERVIHRRRLPFALGVLLLATEAAAFLLAAHVAK